MNLRDQFKEDLQEVFFSTEEFATRVSIDSVEVVVIVSNTLRKKAKEAIENLDNHYSKKLKTYTMSHIEYGRLEDISVGSEVVIDESLWVVLDIEEDGLAVHIGVVSYD